MSSLFRKGLCFLLLVLSVASLRAQVFLRQGEALDSSNVTALAAAVRDVDKPAPFPGRKSSGRGGGCIEATNLNAQSTRCLYGSYNYPDASVGVVDSGASSASSRHTVHSDTAERDPRTGGLLHTVAPGCEASVRLGNWNSNAVNPEGEAVEYLLTVDTSLFDLLTLRYAAVIQDTAFDAADSPRFTLEIRNADGALIASCGSWNLASGNPQMWHVVAENGLRWCDWTSVGVDLAPFEGQQIRIRLTTSDGNGGSRFGYAYYTIQCNRKLLSSSSCGVTDSNTFTAPEGFVYYWYKVEGQNDTVFLGTQQSLSVSSSTPTTYCCRCSLVDHPQCSFVLSAVAGARYPVASATPVVSVSNCRFHVDFVNTSTVVGDTILSQSEALCESAQWFLGNGEQSTQYHASTVYETAGDYEVTLVSAIADGQCRDTARIALHLAWPQVSASIVAPDNLCVGDTLHMTVRDAVNPVWNTGDSDSSLSLLPSVSTNYKCLFTNANGCADSLSHRVTVHNTYLHHDSLRICPANFPILWYDTLLRRGTASGDYLLSRTNVYGCDSSFALHLVVLDNTTTHVFDTVLQPDMPHLFAGRLYHDGVEADTIVSSNSIGCDSLTIYHLHVVGNVYTDTALTVCANSLPVLFNGHLFAAPGSATDTLTAVSGVDSIVTSTLSLWPASDTASVHMAVVENALPLLWNGFTFAADTAGALLTLSNRWGCDSVVAFSLSVFPNVFSDTAMTLCPDRLPVSWHGRMLSAPGTFSDTLPAASGADSIVTLTLSLWPRSDTASLAAVVTENQLPYLFQGAAFASDTAHVLFSLTNRWGCDSVVDFSLSVLRNVFSDSSMTVCEGQLPLQWGSHTFTAAGSISDTLVAASGADSIVTLTLAVWPRSDTATIHMTTTENELPFFWNGTFFPSDTVDVFFTMMDRWGCDSVVNFSLSVFRNVFSDTTMTVCSSQLPLLWAGHLFDTAGSITDTVLAASGADSITTMTLLLWPASDTSSVQVVVTENELPYVWNGLYVTSDTTNAFVTLPNQWGCDSVVALSLVVLRNVRRDTSMTVCRSQLPLQWNGHTFTEGGSISDTLLAASGADSIVTMTLFVNLDYSFHDSLFLCRSDMPVTWRDTVFAVDAPAGYYFRSLTTTAGCDSVLSLYLHIADDYETVDHIESCLPLTWINGVTYTARTFGPQVHLTAVNSCDSTVTLDFRIIPGAQTFVADSFCAATSYFFGGNECPSSGTYRDTLQTAEGCDSIIVLTLTKLEIPQLEVTVDYDCNERGYLLSAQSSVDYLRWDNANGYWNDDWGLQEGGRIWVVPDVTVTLTATADYTPADACPHIDTLTLRPIVVPEARLRVAPEQLNETEGSFYAYDNSRGARTRQWWVDGIFYGSDAQIVCTPPHDADSAVVLLVAESEWCYDTARQVVPIFHHAFWAPNVFTPDENGNDAFAIVADGIVEYHLTVFSRSGLLVFETTDPEAAWHGEYRGKKAPQGTYVWIATYTTTEKPRQKETVKGTVTLLR